MKGEGNQAGFAGRTVLLIAAARFLSPDTPLVSRPRRTATHRHTLPASHHACGCCGRSGCGIGAAVQPQNPQTSSSSEQHSQPAVQRLGSKAAGCAGGEWALQLTMERRREGGAEPRLPAPPPALPPLQVIPALAGDATDQTPPDLPSYLFKERIVYVVSRSRGRAAQSGVWRGGSAAAAAALMAAQFCAAACQAPSRHDPQASSPRERRPAWRPCSSAAGLQSTNPPLGHRRLACTPGLQGMSLVPAVTELVLAEMLYLQYDNPTRPIYMYINSTGVIVSGARAPLLLLVITMAQPHRPLAPPPRCSARLGTAEACGGGRGCVVAGRAAPASHQTRQPGSCGQHAGCSPCPDRTCCRPPVLARPQKGSGKLGYESEAFAIYDTMRYIKPPVATVCVGSAFGEAAMLLAAGEAGRRAALPSTSIMIRQPMQRYTQMQASDIDIYRNELRKTNAEVVRRSWLAGWLAGWPGGGAGMLMHMARWQQSAGAGRTARGALGSELHYNKRSAGCWMRGPASGVSQGTPCAAALSLPLRRMLHPQVRLLSKHTGHGEEQVARDISRPKYFNPYEAIEYGIIDRVLEPEEEEVRAVVRAAQQPA